MPKIRIAGLFFLLAFAAHPFLLAQRGHLPGEIPLDHYPAFAVSELDDVDSFVEHLFQWQHKRLRAFYLNHGKVLPHGVHRDQGPGLRIAGTEACEFLRIGFQLSLVTVGKSEESRAVTTNELMARGMPPGDLKNVCLESEKKTFDNFFLRASLPVTAQLLDKIMERRMPSDAWIKGHLRAMNDAVFLADRDYAKWTLNRFSNHGRRVLLSYIHEMYSKSTDQIWKIEPDHIAAVEGQKVFLDPLKLESKMEEIQRQRQHIPALIQELNRMGNDP